MKPLILLGILGVSLSPLQAQLFRPEAVRGAALGAVAGAIIGNNSGDLGHNAWRGAAWGAGAGLLLGSVIGDASDAYGWERNQVPVPERPRLVPRRNRDNRRPNARQDNNGVGRPDYRGRGLVLGGIAGAIIGNNSGDLGHNTWRGAAWGAGIGYVLGAIAETNAPRRPLPARPAPVQPVRESTSSPQITIINNYYYGPVTAMSGVNGMFGRD